MNLVIEGHDDVVEVGNAQCVKHNDVRYPSRYKKLVSYTLNWRTRNILEASVRPTLYITFSYNPESYIEDRLIDGDLKATLKDDWQRFLKRFRTNWKRDLGVNYVDQNFRYYAITERGDDGRLHWHALFFGFDHRTYPGTNKKGQKILFVEFSPITRLFEKSWGQGFVYFESAVPENINYVTKYLHKRVISPDYISMKSNGIGLAYFTEARKKYFQENETFEIHLRGKVYYMPRYIKNKVFEEDKRKQLNEDLAADIAKKLRESALCKFGKLPLFRVFDIPSCPELLSDFESLVHRCVGYDYDVDKDDLKLRFAEPCEPYDFLRLYQRVNEDYRLKSIYNRRI